MMKKSIFWKITGLAALIFGLGAGFTSCHDNIYSMIEMEVVQEEGLNGDISQIVPFNGSLWCTNYKLYKKDITPSSSTGRYNGQWYHVDAKCNGSDLEFITTIATDGSKLYCYTVQWEEDGDDSVNIPYYKRVYSSSDGETWTQIDIHSITGHGDSSDSYAVNTVMHVFDNRAGDGTNSFTSRKAYVRLYNPSTDSYEIHELSDTTVSSSVASGSSGSDFSAVYINGSTKFSNSLDMVAGNGKAYRTSGSDIEYSSNGSDWTSVDFDKGTIWALAVTADYLLVGTSDGIYKSHLDSGVPSSSATDFSNNAQSLLTSRVTGLYVLDSSRNEGDTDEYGSMIISGYLSSSSDTFGEIGLYAYYPGRGVWNRDGD
ncbi:MAG: hypothetical protein IKR40_00395 [Treponema sp.]|nr:hypothetical protein [Treponema sp.]